MTSRASTECFVYITLPGETESVTAGNLTKKEAVIEHIARTTLARILLNEPLWQHFTNKTALAEFWARPAAERQAIWGPPIDPMVALAEFDERYFPHAERH
jgi:hypothetical protein